MVDKDKKEMRLKLKNAKQDLDLALQKIEIDRKDRIERTKAKYKKKTEDIWKNYHSF